MASKGLTGILSDVVNRYKQFSLPVKSSFWFMVCSFATKSVAMVTTPIFTRIIPKNEYGITSTFSSWQVLLEIGVSLCLSSCGMVLYVRWDNKKRILSALCSLELMVTGVWQILCCIFVYQFSAILGLSPLLCICLFLILMANQSISLWMGYKRYIYEYRASVIVTFLLSTMSSVFGVLCVVFISPTAESRIVPMTVVTVAIGFYFYISIIRKNRVFFDREIWAFAFSYGIPLIPHYVAQYILSSSDRLMIYSMCGPEDAAMYSVAYAVGNLINMFTSAINASFAPYQFESIKNKNYSGLAKRADQVLVIVGVVLAGIMVFSYEIVFIFGGKQYLDCVDIIIPVCLGVYFNYMFQLFARVQEYYLHKKTIVTASVLCAFLNLILNYIFIDLYSYKAAAYTTFICYFLFCLFHYMFYRRVLQMDLKGEKIYNIRNIALISATLILVAVLIAFVNKLLWLKYSVIFVDMISIVLFRKHIIKILKGLRGK